jgi:S-DNA-T family DNA segregation ATPase FtsK/SpoIIIE
VILSTQRPDAKVVTPLIKANLQLKIALKVTTSTNSNVILDTKGAENLMGNGDMLVGGAVPLIRLQGPLATKSDFMEVGNS